MTQVDTNRQETTIGQLPAETNQKGKMRLDLMSIQKALDANVAKCDGEIVALGNAQYNTFIPDNAVTLQTAQSVAERLRGRWHIIEKTHLAKIQTFGDVEPEKIVLQCVCDQLNKFDLTFHREPNTIVFNLLSRQASLRY